MKVLPPRPQEMFYNHFCHTHDDPGKPDQSHHDLTSFQPYTMANFLLEPEKQHKANRYFIRTSFKLWCIVPRFEVMWNCKVIVPDAQYKKINHFNSPSKKSPHHTVHNFSHFNKYVPMKIHSWLVYKQKVFVNGVKFLFYVFKPIQNSPFE